MCTGYVEVQVDGLRFLGHRLAWYYVNKEWPECGLDHIDGVRSNNRIANLRLATQSQNLCNKAIQSNNKCGVRGVVWDERRGKWRAYANLAGRHYHGGHHDSLEAAKKAREKLSKVIHGEYSPEGIR